MNRMRTLLGVVLCAVAALTTQQGTAVHAADGISVAAHACQRGGYTSLVGTNSQVDTTFVNSGQCVSYAAHVGLLVPTFLATPCLGGGYNSLQALKSTFPFPSEAACVYYVGLGGKLQSATAPSLQLTDLISLQSPVCIDSNCYYFTANLNGAHFTPGDIVILNCGGPCSIYDSGSPWVLVQPDGSFTYMLTFFTDPVALTGFREYSATDQHGHTAFLCFNSLDPNPACSYL